MASSFFQLLVATLGRNPIFQAPVESTQMLRTIHMQETFSLTTSLPGRAKRRLTFHLDQASRKQNAENLNKMRSKTWSRGKNFSAGRMRRLLPEACVSGGGPAAACCRESACGDRLRWPAPDLR
jgi:hypothetical protein